MITFNFRPYGNEVRPAYVADLAWYRVGHTLAGSAIASNTGPHLKGCYIPSLTMHRPTAIPYPTRVGGVWSSSELALNREDLHTGRRLAGELLLATDTLDNRYPLGWELVSELDDPDVAEYYSLLAQLEGIATSLGLVMYYADTPPEGGAPFQVKDAELVNYSGGISTIERNVCGDVSDITTLLYYTPCTLTLIGGAGASTYQRKAWTYVEEARPTYTFVGGSHIQVDKPPIAYEWELTHEAAPAQGGSGLILNRSLSTLVDAPYYWEEAGAISDEVRTLAYDGHLRVIQAKYLPPDYPIEIDGRAYCYYKDAAGALHYFGGDQLQLDEEQRVQNPGVSGHTTTLAKGCTIFGVDPFSTEFLNTPSRNANSNLMQFVGDATQAFELLNPAYKNGKTGTTPVCGELHIVFAYGGGFTITLEPHGYLTAPHTASGDMDGAYYTTAVSAYRLRANGTPPADLSTKTSVTVTAHIYGTATSVLSGGLLQAGLTLSLKGGTPELPNEFFCNPREGTSIGGGDAIRLPSEEQVVSFGTMGTASVAGYCVATPDPEVPSSPRADEVWGGSLSPGLFAGDYYGGRVDTGTLSSFFVDSDGRVYTRGGVFGGSWLRTNIHIY